MSKLHFWLVICIAKNFIWTTLKGIFSIFRFSLHLQIPDIQIVLSQILSYLNKTIHQWKAYLFSLLMIYKSQFKKKLHLRLILWSRPGSHMLWTSMFRIFDISQGSAFMLALCLKCYTIPYNDRETETVRKKGIPPEKDDPLRLLSSQTTFTIMTCPCL